MIVELIRTPFTRQGEARHVCSKHVVSNRRVVAGKNLSLGGSALSPARAPRQRRSFAKRRTTCGQHRHTGPKNSLVSATRSGSRVRRCVQPGANHARGGSRLRTRNPLSLHVGSQTSQLVRQTHLEVYGICSAELLARLAS